MERDFRDTYLDTLEFDVDYQDRLQMERSSIKEFIDAGQAAVLYNLWANVDKEEQAVREKMFPEFFINEDEEELL